MATAKPVSDDDIVAEVRLRLTEAWNHDRENRENSFNDLKFLAGDQWPEHIRQQREAQGRPCLTIPRLMQFVNQIANNVRANPPSLKAIPTGGGATQELSKLYSGLFRQIQYRSNATIAFCLAEFYAVAAGMGHFRIVTDYVDDNVFDQEILIKHIPFPNSVFWDPNSTELTRRDAEHCLVSDLIGRRAFEERWPDAAMADMAPPMDSNVENGLFWSTRDAVRVCEYWVKRYKKRMIARLQTGETVDLTDLGKDEVSKMPILATRPVNSYEILQYLVSGQEVLDGPNKWQGRYLPIFPVIGSEIALDTKIVRSGLIRGSKDAQHAYNFSRSAEIESLGQQPKAPYLMTPQMLSKFKAQWDTANTVNRNYLLFEHDPNMPGGPRREAPPQVPSAFQEQAGVASDEMKATTGVYDAALGARSNEISGIAIKARESQGDNATLHFQDNLMATLQHLGTALVDLIPKIYDADRTISIIGDDDETIQTRINVLVPGPRGQMTKINDMSVGEYQIAVKMSPSYATQRQEAASSLLELVQSVPTAAPYIGDLIVGAMDFPGSDVAAQRLKTMLPPPLNPTPPTPEQQQQQQKQQQFHDGMQQATLAKTQGEALKTSADAAKSHAEAQQIAAGNMGGQSAQPAQPEIPQQTPEEQQTARLKNALLSFQVMTQQGRVSDAAQMGVSRQLDNAKKMRDLSQPTTEQIP